MSLSQEDYLKTRIYPTSIPTSPTIEDFKKCNHEKTDKKTLFPSMNPRALNDFLNILKQTN